MKEIKMEKKFIVINYGVHIDGHNELLRDVILRLTYFMLENSQYPFDFSISAGTGPRGDKGVWLIFDANKLTTTVPTQKKDNLNE